MKKFLLLLFLLSMPVLAFSQYYSEGFEAYDSLTIPPDWKVVNNAGFPIDPFANWTIRDSGKALPNITYSIEKRSRAYNSLKAFDITWGAGIDTVSGTPSISDAWLITKKFNNIPTDALFSFYACGGSASYLDSLQIWLSPTGDTALSSFTVKLSTIVWTPPVVYGNFTNYFYDLSAYAGLNVRLAFRYYMNVTVDGYVVMLDQVEMFGTIGVNPIGSNIPKEYALHQNYPNPFNPQTTIKFDLAKASNVKLEVFNSLGQLVQTIYNGFKPAGYYEATFNAASLTSGIYFYRLTTDNFVQTKKLSIVK